MLAVLANVTNTPASAGTTKAIKLHPPWYNTALTKELYLKIVAHDEMESQRDASNKMCEQAEATNKQLRQDNAELGQRLSRAESELAQEHVDREQERRQAAHQNKELRKALREVRDIVRASNASIVGDRPARGLKEAPA